MYGWEISWCKIQPGGGAWEANSKDTSTREGGSSLKIKMTILYSANEDQIWDYAKSIHVSFTSRWDSLSLKSVVSIKDDLVLLMYKVWG